MQRIYVLKIYIQKPHFHNCLLFLFFTATGVGVGGGFGLGGLPNKPASADHISPWLSTDPSSQIDINQVLPANTMPVNSLDVDGDRLVCGTDGEAIYVASNIYYR